MAVAVMQPYLFPYLGYYQMVNSVDHFVFYDDVNFIKGGWIHRNRILINKEPKYIAAPMLGASSFKKINEIAINLNEKAQRKLLNSINQNYGKSPFYNEVMPVIISVITKSTQNLAKFSANSVKAIAEYLSLDVKFYFSSELKFGHEAKNREDRLVEIIKGLKSKTYINAQGGKELYSKEFFQSKEIDLKFINSFLSPYPQNSNEFIPGLSIIDVLMNNSKEDVLMMLSKFELE